MIFSRTIFVPLALVILSATPAWAQKSPEAASSHEAWQPAAVPVPVPAQETPDAVPPAGEAAPANATPEPPPAFEDYPSVRLQSLDKVTARTMTFQARVGATVKFGPLYIKTRACRKPPVAEKPEAAAFLQIWEDNVKTGEPHWVFSGWMFASSPALSAMDHPIYDVWVLDCLAAPNPAAAAPSSSEESDPPENPAASAPVQKP